MTINSKTMAALVVTIIFGGILISAQLGWWQTESNKVAATFTEGEFAGQADPADIRGSYTFGDVEKNFGVSASVLGSAFNISGDPAAFQIKNLEGTATESGVEIGTTSVRLFVAFYKDLPFDLSTDIYLPETATALLMQQELTPEQSAYLTTHTVKTNATGSESLPDATTAPGKVLTDVPEGTPNAEATTLTESTDRSIKGRTTFGEILGWGVPQDSIEQILGKPMPSDVGTIVKDFCTTNSLSFESIKTALQVEVDKLK